MVFKENILGLTVTVRFQKNEFLKSLVHITDNIAGIVGGPQYYLREEEGDPFPCPVII